MPRELRPSHLLLLSAVALLVLLLAACGGDDNAPSSADDAPAGASRPAATATSAPSGELDLSAAFAKLQALQSFRFNFAFKLSFAAPGSTAPDPQKPDEIGAAAANFLFSLLGDFRSEGVFRAPGDLDLTLTYAGQDVRFVQVGQQAWINEDGAWSTTDPSVISGAGPSIDVIGDLLPVKPLPGGKTRIETVNGVRALRYSFDKATLEQFSPPDPAATSASDDVNLDVWLNESGVPVRLLLVATGKDETGRAVTLRLELNLRDIDNKSIEIKPPA